MIVKRVLFRHHHQTDDGTTTSIIRTNDNDHFDVDDDEHDMKFLRRLRINHPILLLWIRIIRRTCSICSGMILLIFMMHRLVSYYVNFVTVWMPPPLMMLRRPCPPPEYVTMEQVRYEMMQQNPIMYPNYESTYTSDYPRPMICIASLADSSSKNDIWHNLLRFRHFDNIMNMTSPHKVRYCQKHRNCHYFDESNTSSFDSSRPPSWSKIKAALRLMSLTKTVDKDNDNATATTSTMTTTAIESDDGVSSSGRQLQQKRKRKRFCDWVLWLDADTVIMNSNITIESFLPHHNYTYDWILTPQKVSSWNAGAWLIRNTAWSRHILSYWWNHKSFVQPKGISTSGDNAALKFMLTNLSHHDPKQFARHIHVVPRCTFNSDAKFMTVHEYHYYEQQYHRHPYRPPAEYIPAYGDIGRYHQGDFIAHIPGIDSKISTTQLLLNYAT